MADVLVLQEVSKHYANHAAVRDVSLTIERGTLFALLGPSGCGKTTTLRLIAGFEHPSSGQILLSGEDIAHRKPYERNVSTVFQSYALFPHMTVRQNVEFGLKRKGKSGADLNKAVAAVLELVRMSGKEDRYPAKLSGGEKQRVALARSLVLQPEVLLLDEPLSALDPNLRKQVRGELRSLQRESGTTFVMVTHDKEEALAMADQVAVMHEGRLEQVGSPQEIYLRPKSRFVASFLGAVNWIGGIGVRPESIQLYLSPNGHTRSARIESAVFLGNVQHITAQLADGAIVVAETARRDPAFSPGGEIHLSWDPQDELRLP